MSSQAASIADGYWATEFGCSTDELFATPFGFVTHGAELADYRGVFALFRRQAWLDVGGWKPVGYEDWDFWLSCAEQGHPGLRIPRPLALDDLDEQHLLDGREEVDPDEPPRIGGAPGEPADRQRGGVGRQHAETLRALLSALPPGCSPDDFARALETISSALIGPASIAYAESVPPPTHPARALGPDDALAVDTLRQSCDAGEWAHGGGDLERPCAAVFVGGQIAALASYEVWSGAIAHLYIVTHPGHRGRGFGRSAVAYLAGCAIAAGLLPQYRTLVSNRASSRLAEALGFCHYAMSMAVRLDRGA